MNRQSLQTRFGRITFDGEGDMLQRFSDAAIGNIALTRLVEQEILVTKLTAALREAERFMDYFANDRHEFVGPGTPLDCLETIRDALKQTA